MLSRCSRSHAKCREHKSSRAVTSHDKCQAICRQTLSYLFIAHPCRRTSILRHRENDPIFAERFTGRSPDIFHTRNGERNIMDRKFKPLVINKSFQARLENIDFTLKASSKANYSRSHQLISYFDFIPKCQLLRNKPSNFPFAGWKVAGEESRPIQAKELALAYLQQ